MNSFTLSSIMCIVPVAHLVDDGDHEGHKVFSTHGIRLIRPQSVFENPNLLSSVQIASWAEKQHVQIHDDLKYLKSIRLWFDFTFYNV